MIRILLFSFIPILLFSAPNWMFSLVNKDYEIIGYGIANNLSEAKQNAITDIAQSISTNVESSLDMYKQDNNGKIDHKTSIRASLTSSAILSGVKYIKFEQDTGIWYVAAKYNNAPIESKFKQLLPKNLNNEHQNRYLNKTPLAEKINSELTVILDYEIIRKDKLWQLEYNGRLIPLSQQNFYQLFSNQSNENLSIVSNQKLYCQYDDMFLNIEHKESGYISILYVEHNGKVGILLANRKSNASFNYPDIKKEGGLQVINPYKTTVREMYVTLYSKAPIDLSLYEYVENSLLDDSNFNFDKLLLMMDKYDYSTYQVKIKI